jgi:small subunit ribosomal protein S5
MEEQKKVAAPVQTEAKTGASVSEGANKPAAAHSGNRNFEQHGSASSSRPGDRKFGDHKGRPGERRGGRGGFHRDELEYEERVVDINRVARVVQGGKHIRFDALVVIGDGKGKYGFALAKSGEVPDAIKKSLTKAKKKIYMLHISKGATIAHPIIGTFADTKVFLKPAPQGTGIIAGGAVRAILELAGIKNVYSKVYGSRTPINVIRATHNGLQNMKDYDKVMILRGLKTPEEIKALHPAIAPKAVVKPAFNKPAAAPVQTPAQAPVQTPTPSGKPEGGK